MTVLYLDTSSPYFYAAVYQDGKILGEKNEFLAKEMSSEALPKLKELLEEVKLLPDQVDRIMIVNGPGSFTGIRVGMTIAKVYAWALKKEILPVSALTAMALSTDQNLVLPIIDARRGFVYGALYQKGKVLLPDGHYQLDKFLMEAKQYGTYTIVSNDSFPSLKTIPYHPNYLKIIETFLEEKPITVHFVNPEYLKRTEAEEKKFNANY